MILFQQIHRVRRGLLLSLTLALALLLPLGAWATSHHTITIDGTIDEWDTDTERMETSSSGTYGYITWDAASLYVAWPQVDFDGYDQACYVAVDTDPRSDPDTGDGTTNLGAEQWLRGSAVILPFNADILFMVTEDNAALEEHTYHYYSGAWEMDGANGSTDYRGAFSHAYGNASGNNKDLEFSIDRAAIGKAASGDAVYVAAYCKNLDDDGGWGYLHRAMPNNAVTDGENDKTFSHYLGYVLDSGIAPNATAHQDCDPAPVVTSAADSGTGSLRQAIAKACPGATVTFNNTLAGETITLASELSITKTLTVDGGSQAVTVSGNNVTRVFDVGASGVVTLSHLSIVSGTTSSSGGGIHNAGALTVQDCVLSDNVSAENGGGIFNIDGVLTVQNSVLSGNQAGAGGGGIGNRGALTLQDSTLSGNSASYGGGIFNADGGQMMVYNSTLSGNAATSDSPYYGGGAIDQWVSSGSVSGAIINSTLVSNTAVSANTSGIWVEAGTLTLRNSIVANNNGANNFYQTGEGVFTFQGYNLSNAWNGLTTQATDLTADPLLGPLADNGGKTRTHALLPGSPAIDAGDPASCPDTDQRGVTRPQVGSCDIGAFESQGFTLTYSSGSGQSTSPGTTFANPLALTVSSSAGEPVDSGQIVFTGPASGAALSSSPLTVTINGGTASQMVAANGIGGSYVVTATTRGGLNSVSYSLTNAMPEITVIGNGQVIDDGDASPSTADHTDFGSVGVGQALTRTFTISNSGGATLALTGTPAVSLSGTDAFSVVAQPATSVEPSASVTFQVRFTPSVTGTQVATVTIANNDSDEAPYDFVIKGMGAPMATTNQAPAANAGSDQSVSVGAAVTLDGSGSTDPDGHTPLSYGWTQTGGPAVTLSNAAAVSPTFTAPGTPTVLTFTLRVTDSFGLAASAADEVVITVKDVSAIVYLPLVQNAYTTASGLGIAQLPTTAPADKGMARSQ